MEYLIRPFQPKDRSALRRLAIGTADVGNKPTFRDLDLLADHLTLYYTDVEPQSTFVVENENQVVGYLTGCLETKNYLAWLKMRGYPMTFLRLLKRHFFHFDMWVWAWSRVKTLQRGGAHQPQWMDRFPSHLHMNLETRLRGKGIGSALLNKFENYAREAGSQGIHLSTLSSNENAQRFFSKNGFVKVNEVVAYRPLYNGTGAVSVAIMAKSLLSQ